MFGYDLPGEAPSYEETGSKVYDTEAMEKRKSVEHVSLPRDLVEEPRVQEESSTHSLIVGDRLWDQERMLRGLLHGTSRREEKIGAHPKMDKCGATLVCCSPKSIACIYDMDDLSAPAKTLHIDGKTPTSCLAMDPLAGVFGFSTGHLLYYSLENGQKQLNEGLYLSKHAVVSICRFPESSHLVFVAFNDCKLVMLDLRYGSDKTYTNDMEAFCQTQAELNPRSSHRTFLPKNSRLNAMKCSKHLIACAGSCGNVAVTSMDVKDGRPSFSRHSSFKTYFGAALSLAFSENGTLLCVGGQDDMITVYDCKKKTLIKRLTGHSSFVNDVCFFDGPKQDLYEVASVGEDSNILFFKFNSGEDVEKALTVAKKDELENLEPDDFTTLRGMTTSCLTGVIWCKGRLLILDNGGVIRIFKE